MRQVTASSLVERAGARHAARKTEDVESPHELLYGFTYTASDVSNLRSADTQRFWSCVSQSSGGWC